MNVKDGFTLERCAEVVNLANTVVNHLITKVSV
jgi:hypothetical protein